jgi:hypothetical protein
MKLFINNSMLPLNQEGKVWEAQNGATRRTLVVINKIAVSDGQVNFIDCSLGFLDKGNHSFIFINPNKFNDDRILGLFLNRECGFKVVEGNEMYSNNSIGGYGNSESKFGIYEVGTIIEVTTYKNRKTPTYYKLTTDGWVNLGVYEVAVNEITEI